MALHIVTGRAGSGKSRYLMGKIKELLQNPFEKIIVIVPGQLTFETEKRILRTCGVCGILGLEVLSIQRLALKILDDTGSTEFMSSAEKAMVCHLALAAFESPFDGTGHQPDFEVCLGALFSRLKAYGQSPQSIREAASRQSDAALLDKLNQTAAVYQKYIDICGSRMDLADMYTLAASRAKHASFLQGAHVFIDGLDSFAPAVMALLGPVMACSQQVFAAFRSTEGGADEALFASEKRDMERLCSAAYQAGLEVKQVQDVQRHCIKDRYKSDALRFLEENLYRYPYTPFDGEAAGISIVEADSMEHEVSALAAGIIDAVRGGKRFADIAVVGGGIEAYLPAVKSIFQQYGIPCFIDERRALSENAFFAFLYSALCAAAGDTAAVQGYIFSEYAPLDAQQRRALYLYSQRYAYRGWHFFGPFVYADDAAQMELLRRNVMQPLQKLKLGIDQPDAQLQADAIIRFLEDCGVSAKIEALTQSLDAADTGECAYFGQVYQKSMEVIGGIARIAANRPLSPNTLCSLVKTGFESTKIAVIPPMTDEVAVFDISVAQLPDIDVLFAIGVHDGVWPARDDGAGILSAAERDILQQNGLDIGVFDIAEQKLKVYTALAKPKERLIISYNAQSGQPSVLIDRLRRLFPALVPKKPDRALSLHSGNRADVLFALSQALRGSEPDETLMRTCAYYLRKPEWRKSAQAILLRDNAAVCVSQQTANALYGPMRCSATRIENHYRCPYKHFLDCGLRLQIMRDYVSDRIDIGTFMHLALDLFTRSLIDDHADIKALSESQTRIRMQAAVRQAAALHENGKLQSDARFALTYAQLERELIDTALRIRLHFAGSHASIHASEYTFEYTVKTPMGDAVITGKIDRIDTANGYFRVVDYKSSPTKFDANALCAGTSIQLPVYIDAANQKLGGLVPAGGYYMRIGEKYSESGEQAQKDARMAGLSLADVQVLADFCDVLPDGSFAAIDQAVTASGTLNGRGAARQLSDFSGLLSFTRDLIGVAIERIYGGDITICPVKNACGYCDYAAVCQFNEGYEGNAIREPEPFDRALLAEEGA